MVDGLTGSEAQSRGEGRAGVGMGEGGGVWARTAFESLALLLTVVQEQHTCVC